MEFECLDSFGRDILLEKEDESETESWDDEEYKGGPNETDARREYQILLFGSTAKGKSICVQVEGYRPSFLVELPTGIPSSKLKTFSSWMLESIHPSAASRVTFTHERHKTLWDYNGEAFSDFIRIDFPSISLWRRCIDLFWMKPTKDKKIGRMSIPMELSPYKLFGIAGPKITLKLYEANLDPLLRFFHERNLSPAGWMSLTDAGMADTTEANTAHFVTCDWKKVTPLTRDLHAPLLVASWDIECMSAHGDFPLPQKTWRKPARELLEQNISTYEGLCEALAFTFLTEKPLSSIHLKNKPATPPTTALIDSLLSGSKKEITAALKSKDIDALEETLTCAMPSIEGDQIIQIGVVLYRQGAPVKKHIWVLGGCDRDTVRPPGIEVPIDVYVFSEESALIKSFSKWVGTTDPDVMIGYNIFGFDERFLWYRAKELGIESCLKSWNRLTTVKAALEKKELSSAAMGDNTMYILKSTGRLQIDLMHHIKKNHSLDSYSLDNVSATFVSGAVIGKVEEIKKDEFRFATKSTKGTVVGRFITLLDEENDRVVDRCEVIGVEPKALIVLLEDGKTILEEHGAAAVRWAQVKDDITPQQIFDSHRGTNKDRAMIAKYCLQDCDLVMELFNKLDVLNNAFAMANVCSVPVGYIFTRGQGIKIESLIFKYARSEDKLMHVLPSASRGGDDSDDPSYEGAIVLEPKTGIYIDQPVTALDFSSLYPSTIISENISHDTLISLKETKGSVTRIIGGSDKFDNLPGAKYVDIEYDLLVPDPDSSLKHPPKVKMGTRVARYIQVPVKGRDTIGNEGMIPKILKMLLSSRKAARKEAEKEPDEFKRALLDAKQLAYKLTANSLYGQLGSNTFKVRRQELAASTTAYGRRQLMFAKDCIERVYGDKKDPRCNAEYVYGDTDSVFISFNPKDPMTGELLHGAAALAAAKSLTEEAGKIVTGCLRAPHDFEFDKIFRTFCLLSKKRYVGDMSEGDLDDFHRKAMGIVMKRRDNAPIVKYIYGGAIDRILDPAQGIRSAFTFVQETAKALLQEKLPMSKLTITKSLKSEYKLVPAHKMLANRITERDPGNAPSTTERIPFVYILPPPGEAPSKLQGDRIETPSYIKEKKLKIDYPFYITNQIAKPVAQVFGLEVEKLPGVTKVALAATVKAKDPVAAREALAESLLFGKLLVEASHAPETMERRGQKSIMSFLK